MSLKKNSLKQIVLHSSNGHLGYSPTKEKSFWKGAKRRPDFYISDSGSADIGPKYLGMDVASSPRNWQKHDLRLMLLASRRQRVPMIIGSARDCGTNAGVDLYVSLIREIAQEERISPFRLTFIYSNIDKAFLEKKLRAGVRIKGLGGFKDLTVDELEATSNIVGVMGVDPIIDALDGGADVVIAGRASDTAIFAAAGIWSGMPKAQSYFAGKALECASFCAEPYGAKETVLGTITKDSVRLEAMADFQRCTPESIAGHLMYERPTPHEEVVPRGILYTDKCRYVQSSPGTTVVTGMRFVAAKRPTIKLEGSGKVGERAVAVVGVRDPMMIEKIDSVIADAKREVQGQYGGKGMRRYQLHYHVYGRDGVMGELEPCERITSHELCVVVEAIAPDAGLARDVALMGARMIFYARSVRGLKGTAGAATILFAEVLKGDPAYRWTLNHVMEVDDPGSLFSRETIKVG